ncbi:MAG: Methyl-accepting chemotaxis protein [Lachnoclostridium sp.]|jgi:ABC-type transport system substrate-binding protein
MDELVKKELQEAINAGENALYSLRRAKNSLQSAKNWGLWDIFGGGFLTNIIKHSKLNDASSYMEEARQDLRTFQSELRDINTNINFGIDIGDFLKFADFFFDGFIADYMVQSKINDARRQVDEAIERVESVLAQLRARL